MAGDQRVGSGAPRQVEPQQGAVQRGPLEAGDHRLAAPQQALQVDGVAAPHRRGVRRPRGAGVRGAHHRWGGGEAYGAEREAEVGKHQEFK